MPNQCNLLVHQVKDRTAVQDTFSYGSHVMQYGSLELNVQKLFSYIGTNPANDGNTFVEDNSLPSFSKAVNQRDADLVYFWQKVCNLDCSQKISSFISFQQFMHSFR